MKGIIYHINTAHRMYSVQLADGCFSVFKLVGTAELSRFAEVSAAFAETGEKEMTIHPAKVVRIRIDYTGLHERAALRKTHDAG